MANDYTLKEKGIIRADATKIYPSVDAMYGPWASVEAFRTYLGGILGGTVTDDIIPNSVEIGIIQEDGTVKRYEWQKPTNGQGSWVSLSDSGGAVASVNGKTGAVVLNKSDIGLGNVDNTSDVSKPISAATQTALNAKANVSDLTAHTGSTSNPHGVTKDQVGLGNVDNTADADKVVKRATEDGSGNVIISTYETKNDAQSKITNLASNVADTYQTKTDSASAHTNLQGQITAIQTTVSNLTGLSGTNFGGFSIQQSDSLAVAGITTLFGQMGYTAGDTHWFLAGTSMASLKAYRFNGVQTDPVLISNDVYDFTDFSAISTKVDKFKGTTNDIDSLNSGSDIGIYFYIGASKMGLVSVAYDATHSVVTQHWLSDMTPDSVDPAVLNEGPAILMRSYKNSTWSAWQNPIGELAAEVAVFGPQLDKEENDFPQYNYSVLATGKFGSDATYRHGVIAVNAGDVFSIVSNESVAYRYAFATSDEFEAGGDIPLVDGTSVVEVAGNVRTDNIIIPLGCAYLIFSVGDYYGTSVYKSGARISNIEQTIDEKILPLFAEIAANRIITRTGSLFKATTTNSYITKNHWYIGRTHNSSVQGYENYCKYILVSVTAGEVVRVNPINGTTPHAPRIVFFTQTPTAPSSANNNYSDVTNIMASDVKSISTQRDIVVPEGATSMYVEQAYAPYNVTTATNIAPYTTIRDMNYKVYEDVQSVKEELLDVEQTVEQQGIAIDNKGFTFVEMPKPYKSGKRLYVGETASSRDGKWYTATNSNYLLVSVEGGTTIRITANNERQCRYAFLINDANGAAVTISGETFYEVNYAAGEELRYLDAGETIDLVVPDDANYLYLYNDSVLGRTYFTPSFVGVKRSWEDSINKGAGTDITDWNPEFSMLDLVKSMAYKGKTDNKANVYGCFVFAHITDCHGRDNEQYSKWAWERFLRFCRYYKSMNERFIIDMVDTGDIVADSAAVSGTEVTSNWRADGNEVLIALGNHDVANKVSGSLKYTRMGLTAYNQFLADKINSWNVVQPTDAATNGYCYYYKDYEIGGGESSTTQPTPYGLRAIFIDAMDWLVNGSASLDYHQAAFVKSALDGALSAGRHVIIFAHEWPGAMINFNCTWNESPYNEHYQDIDDTNGKTGNDSTYTYLAFLVAKFQEDGGGFAGYVCGHHHAGFIGQKTGTCTFDGETIDFDNGTPQIVICGTYARLMITSFTSQSGNLAWCDLNTKNQDCFRLISVDTSHSYIKLMQIGKEYDYAMRHRDILGINYRTYQPFDESVITYTRNSIVAKDGFLWRILTPAFKDVEVEGVMQTHTDWTNTIKVMYNRVFNQ